MDDPFLSPHTGPQAFTSFPDIPNWAGAPFKAVDAFHVELLHQRGVERPQEFMRVRNVMSDQETQLWMLLTCKGPLHGLSVVALWVLVHGVGGIF